MSNQVRWTPERCARYWLDTMDRILHTNERFEWTAEQAEELAWGPLQSWSPEITILTIKCLQSEHYEEYKAITRELQEWKEGESHESEYPYKS